MQKITIVARVGKDAELKTVGKFTILEFSAACTRKEKDKEETTWYKISKFVNADSKLAGHIKKGDKITVTGDFYKSSYTNKEGKIIEYLEIKNAEIEPDWKKKGDGYVAAEPVKNDTEPALEEKDGDLPF